MINFLSGTVKYDEITHFLNGPNQLTSVDLREDLLQVYYPGELLLDLGWYPEGDPEGSFRLLVVKSFDWENPIVVKQFKDIQDLPGHVNECLAAVGLK